MLWRLESIAITIYFGAIPLLVSPFSKELFEFPKTIFLYFLTGMLLIIISFKSEIKIPANKFSLLLTFILATTIISALFTNFPYTSLFGYYTRFYGGLVSIICIFIFTIYLSSKSDSKNVRDYILRILLITGLTISVYALFQKLGLDKTTWSEDSTRRVFSTLGQPNWLAAYLLPIFYIALYYGLNQKRNAIIKFLPSIIIYLAIWFTYSISGIIALLISFSVLIALNFKKSKKHAIQYWPIIVIALAITFAAAIPLRHRITEQFSNMYGVVSLLRNKNTENFEPNYGDTGKIRLILWQGTLDLITSNPKQFLIGSGPETFAYVFPEFRPIAINATSEANFVHNKPHNWYLEIFSTLGLLGFFAYIGFTVLVMTNFIKSAKSAISKFLFSGWVSILITNFFGWPTVATSILFFALPIFFTDFRGKVLTLKINLIKTAGISLAASFLIFISIIFVIADFHFKRMNYTQAHNLNPFETRYELFALIYSETWDPNYTLRFYEANKHNPYVVKTLANYIEYQERENPLLEDISEVKSEIFEDARKISPADNQFR